MVMKTMYLHRQVDFFTFLMLFNLCIQITHLLHNLDFSPVRIPCLLIRLNYDKVKVKMKSLSHVQLFVTPKDCSLPGSSIHGIFQARVLEWAAIYFSRGSSQSRDRTWVFHIADRRFTIWSTREVHTRELWQKTLQSSEVSHCCNFFWTLNQWNLYLREVPPSLPKNSLIWVRSDTD